MKSTNLWGRIVAVAALLLLVAGGTAFAQLQTGNLYGTVTDDKGAALPGVTATLTGQGAPQVQVTNAQGQFRFLGLGPGSYQLKAELEGFSTIDYPNIVINVGRNTQIEVKLSAAVEDVITVTAESPLLDERRISTGATVSQTELEKIPTSRDPWSILQTTPGVLTDRINVGGNESGQQSNYVGPGSGGDQAVWSVDGVVITDMAALGSSPAYYDFDAFEEMQVTTGGSDSTIATGGVVLNMVTKRGTNEWRGSGRFYDTDKSRQSSTSFDQKDLAQAGLYRTGSGRTLSQLQQFQAGILTNGVPVPSFKQGNRIVSVRDYGAELGGPIVKDRLWIWGSYGRQKVSLLTIADVSDKTDLKTYNGKLNAQIAANNSATAFVINSDKVKIGRNAGPTRPQPTTWDQGKFGPSPTAYKVEDTHIFSSNFYLTGLYSKVNGGFELVPEGGLNVTPFLDGLGIWRNSFLLNTTLRPQKQYKADASNFFNTNSLSHELKFGVAYREAEVTSLSSWPGVGLVEDGPSNFGLPAGVNILAVERNGGASVRNTYKEAYLQDTLTAGNLTVNVGVRYDVQGGENLARSQPASRLLPGLLPAVSVSQQDIGFEWKDFTPRLGITYALGPERKTLLRASYSRFADQLGAGTASQLNTIGSPSFAYFYTASAGNPIITTADVGGPAGFSSNVNPANGLLLQSNGVDPNLKAPKTDELLLSVEHALLPEFVVGANLTYRKITGILQQDLLVFTDADPFSTSAVNSIGRRATRADYVVGGHANGFLPNGTAYSIPYYIIRPGLTTRSGGFLYNGDDEQTYKGASVTFNKRLANRWMLRGNVSYNDWYWSKVPVSSNPDPTQLLGGGQKEGDPVLQGSGTGSGSKGGVYINSKWSYSINGLYQIAPDHPWGFNAALNLTGRQGYPTPFFHRVFLPTNQYPTAPSDNLQVTSSSDSFRNPDVHVVDARVEKEFTFSDVGVTIGVDCFNLLNKSYVLQRTDRLARSTSNNVTEILSPRVIRLGARLSFR
ncbi:MAG TPA: TonB-dependent receptor [Thermoanaerobaculia bacterium]|nr:TonB-dependent receptor [Thermoanaerobaculia bacterium]